MTNDDAINEANKALQQRRTPWRRSVARTLRATAYVVSVPAVVVGCVLDLVAEAIDSGEDGSDESDRKPQNTHRTYKAH